MIEKLDLEKKFPPEQYRATLTRLQLDLRGMAFQLYKQKRLLIVVFEGVDAAGKGGTIKRITERLDPRGYEVFPIAAPAGDDKTHHYLWRFWRRMPPPDEKQVLIFDRSWYGRVLVERVEGFCNEEDWKRAYREINEFERQLADAGALIVKFWVQISKEEQYRRFEEREESEYKSWKLTQEDWRNRAKWDAYTLAVDEMVSKTSTLTAPWTIVEGDDKLFERIKCLNTLVDVVGKGIGVKRQEEKLPL